MLRELNPERRNLVSDIKLEAASRALREAADRLDDRMIPLKGNHRQYEERNHEEDVKDIVILAVAAGLSAAAVIAVIVLVTKLVKKSREKADEKLEEIKHDLERRIEQA